MRAVPSQERLTTVALSPKPGAEWVDRFLAPLLGSRGLTFGPGFRILQIEPDDEEEAIRIRELGSMCDVMISSASRYATSWHCSPVCASPLQLPLATGSYRLAFTGALATLLKCDDHLERIASELSRVIRPGGAVFLTVRNPQFPLWRREATHIATLSQIERSFKTKGRFASVDAVSLENHFTGQRLLRGPARLLRPIVPQLLRVISNPGATRLYSSPLNPAFALWISK